MHTCVYLYGRHGRARSTYLPGSLPNPAEQPHPESHKAIRKPTATPTSLRSAGVGGLITADQALVSGRNLSVTPPLRCIASGSHTTGTGCDPRFEPTYFFANNMFNDVVYRIVYVYLDGAHSCPSPLTVRAVSKLYGECTDGW